MADYKVMGKAITIEVDSKTVVQVPPSPVSSISLQPALPQVVAQQQVRAHLRRAAAVLCNCHQQLC